MFLTRKQHYGLILANWLYENPTERAEIFVKNYHEDSISAIVHAENAGVGVANDEFIYGNMNKFIICNIFCKFVKKFIKKISNTVFDFQFIDLLRIYEDDPTFIEEHFKFFRNCEFEKINKLVFIEYAQDFDHDNATDDSFGSMY